MSNRSDNRTRRDFLKGAACGILGGLASWSLPLRASPPGGLFIRPGQEAPQEKPATVAGPTSRAALIHGESRAENTFRALKLIEDQVKAGLAHKKRIVLKPNMVSTRRQLSATHVDCLEGMLEFFAPLAKDKELIVAESPAGGTAAEGYDNYGYSRLEKKYKVRFVDLDAEPLTIRHVIDHRFHPHPVRFSKMLLAPDVYLVSVPVMKTHDRTVVTLSLKNVAVGGILKDSKYRWGRRGRARSDKSLVHGGKNNAGIHWNLFQLAKQIPTDLAILDGFQAMEHNGPVGGKPVDHKIAIASTDWLAADRLAVELMGFDFEKVGYLWFCHEAKLGQGDLGKIQVLGEKVQDHIRTYKPHDSIERQYQWM